MKIEVNCDSNTIRIDKIEMKTSNPLELIKILVEIFNHQFSPSVGGVILIKVDEGVVNTIDEW